MSELPNKFINNNNEPASGFEQSTSSSTDYSLLDYLLIIAKHKKMILGTTFVIAVLTAIISLLMPNIYTGKTMILPADEDKGMLMGAMLSQIAGIGGGGGGGGGLSGILGGVSKAEMYITILKSEAIKDPIIDKFKLMELYEAKYRVDAYKKLGGSSKFTAGKKDGIITIEVDAKDPKLAAALANSYVDELGKLVAGLGMTGSGRNRIFLEKRLVEAKADLAKAEDDLKAFQSKNKAISLPDQARATIEGVGQLRAQLAMQEVQLHSLQSQFTDGSQEIKTAKASIASIRSQLAALEGKGEGSSSIPSVGSVPQLGQEYVRRMREFKIQETVLELLTKQYEMVKINEVKDVSPFQVIQKASLPERKSKPFRSLIVLVITFFAGILMACLAILKEHIKQMQSEEREQIDLVLSFLPKPIARLWGLLVS